VSTLATIGFLLGVSFASGLNLYAAVAVLGLLGRFEVVTLPAGLEVLTHPVVLAVAIALYLIEFFADKIPYLDSIWDVIHTFIRPPAAALLAWAALVELPPAVRVVAGLVADGVALTSHGAKASTRAAVNTSPEPVSNSIASLAEDGLAVFLVWMAVTHPILTAVIVLVLLAMAVWVVVKLIGGFRRLLRWSFHRARPSPDSGSASSPPS
jgi:hypothetical protein